MAKFRVGIIGRFAFGRNLLNGQTIKTKIVSSALADALGEDNIHRVDTYGSVKALLRLPVQCIIALVKCQNVIMLPAYKGIRVIAPVLAISNLIARRKLHYMVIGGWLGSFLDNKPFLSWCLKSFDGVYVETRTMKQQLETQGFENVYVMPNFKNLTLLAESELVYSTKEPYRVCTFSRVMREKGIEEAVEAVKTVNAQCGRIVYTLHIYGQIDEAQIDWFENLQQTFPPEIRYMGTVCPDQSVEVLKDYFALLFPTFYSGEGFAGTIIDSFSAGVPVIASRWLYNEELIQDGVEGALVPARDMEALKNKLIEIGHDPTAWNEKKQFCLGKAQQYRPEIAIQPLLEQLQQKGSNNSMTMG